MKATHYFHKITIGGRASKYSAWFNGDPMGDCGSLAVLVDCERIDGHGRSYPCTTLEKDILANRGGWYAREWGKFKRETIVI